MTNVNIDRLAILTISDSQSAVLMKQLSEEDFHFTVIDSTSGLLRDAEICLLVGFSHSYLPALLELVRRNCTPYRQYIPAQGVMPGELSTMPMVEAQLGGALVYVMDVVRFEQL